MVIDSEVWLTDCHVDIDLRVTQSWPGAVLSEPVLEIWAFVKVEARSEMSLRFLTCVDAGEQMSLTRNRSLTLVIGLMLCANSST